jgi:hypothetical protein
VQLNFPAEARARGPADGESLRAEAHRRFKETTTSRFRGVSWNKRAERWVAQIKKAGQHQFLGLFDVEEDAGEAYDKAARRLHGRVAKVNFPS